MAGRFSLERSSHAGYEARRLADSAAGLEAVFLPGLGMVGASLTHRGDELLGRTDNLGRYASEGSTMGIPLLHPWANRLDGYRYSAGDRDVELDPASPLLHPDGNGLPIHGVAAASPYWSLIDERTDDLGALLAAELDFGAHPDLLAAFPFPHRLVLEVTFADEGLTIRTTLAATGDVPVPVSFGYHPYLRLPGVARAGWHVELPVTRRLLLDELMIPTGDEEPFSFPSGPLAERVFDDGFAALASPPEFVLAGGGRRIALTFLDGYPYAQVFAPAGKDFICFEPMTAPTNALVSGTGLEVVAPGSTYTASFRIAVSATAS